MSEIKDLTSLLAEIGDNSVDDEITKTEVKLKRLRCVKALLDKSTPPKPRTRKRKSAASEAPAQEGSA